LFLSLSSIEFADCVDHGDNILHWRCCLDVMDGVENESAAGRKDLASAQNLFAHFAGRSEGQSFLRVHASTPEDELIAEVGFQLRRVHPSGRALHGIEDVEAGINERGQEL